MQKNNRPSNSEIKEWVHGQMPELIEILKEICRIRSVAEVKDASVKPYGQGCIDVLQEMLRIGGENGFAVRNYDNYVGSITLPGKTKENIGIWAHLDVVDEGEDWDYAPYEPTVRDGYMIARGCNDNKSSAAMALYVLKFMKEHDIALNHTLELYCGTCEEQGMYDLDYFTEHYECPTLSLVPDSGFPVCCGERGVLNGRLTFGGTCTELLDVKCDCGLNTVPDKAEVVLRYTPERWEKCRSRRENFTNAEQAEEMQVSTGAEPAEEMQVSMNAETATNEGVLGVRVMLEGDTIRIFAKGVSSQAAIPENGDSALTKLAAFICENELLPESEADIFRMVLDINNEKHDGSALNVYCSDEQSGPTKLVATRLNFADISHFSEAQSAPKDTVDAKGQKSQTGDAKLAVTIDFVARYPFSKNDFPYGENITKAAEERKFTYTLTKWTKATFFNPDRPVVKKLTDCCNEVLGTQDVPFVMSGGTYARKLPNALAFGTGMRVPKAPEGMLRPGHGSYHQPDESISLLRIEKALEVYIRAILEIDEMNLQE